MFIQANESSNSLLHGKPALCTHQNTTVKESIPQRRKNKYVKCFNCCLTMEATLLSVFKHRPTAVYLVSFPQPLSLFEIQFLNAVGDLLDLIPALVPPTNRRLRDFKLPGMGHCSALIKVRGRNMFQSCLLHTLHKEFTQQHRRQFYNIEEVFLNALM